MSEIWRGYKARMRWEQPRWANPWTVFFHPREHRLWDMGWEMADADCAPCPAPRFEPECAGRIA